ncbi:MAG: thrombospondin type 3 repeat-containing protein [Chloroflexota bacterium]
MQRHYLQVSIKVLIVVVLAVGWFSTSFVTPSSVYAQPGTNDTDADGVDNSRDNCPTVAGPASNMGCPLPTEAPSTSATEVPNNDVVPPDSDGDGTADPLDSCPNTPGDGANAGCPEGQTSEDPTGAGSEPDTSSESAPVPLVPMPTTGSCVASPIGSNSVNMRNSWSIDSEIVDTLQVNEMREVWAVVTTNDEQYPTWYLLPWGYVNSSVVRLGGDCSDLLNSEPQVGMGSTILLNPQMTMTLAENTAGFEILETPSGGLPPAPLQITSGQIVLNVPIGGTDILPPHCEVVLGAEAGMYILDCDPEQPEPQIPLIADTLLSPNCEVVLGAEAGMYILDCDPPTPGSPIMQVGDLLSQDCEILNPEAGVYIENCDDDDAPEIILCTDITPENAQVGLECIQIDLSGNQQICTLTSPEAGVYVLTCETDDSLFITDAQFADNSLMLCSHITPENAAPGLQCINDNSEICTLVSTEAGVYTLDCESSMSISLSLSIDEINMLPMPCAAITPENAAPGMECSQVDENGMTQICVLESAEAGVYTLNCEGDATPFVQTVYQSGMLPFCNSLTPETIQAGMECLQADGNGVLQTCVVESAEAGVYTLNCPNDMPLQDLAVLPKDATIPCDALSIEDLEPGLECLETDENGNSQICILESAEAGVYTLSCPDDNAESNSFIQSNLLIACNQITPETAMPGLQCLQADGNGNVQVCTLESAEAGVYTLNCEETGNSINEFAPPPVPPVFPPLVINFSN